MDNPLVTVITPTYNYAEYIAETVQSVLSQSYKNIEYIVIDDGSTDNTQQVLKKFSDPRLTKLRHNNRGEHLTVNVGLKRAQGKYFMYPNADDPLLPGCIEELVEVMELRPHVVCAYPDWCIIGDSSERVLGMPTVDREYSFKDMVRLHVCFASVGSMFRSSVMKDIGYRDPQFKWVSDFDFWLRYGLEGPMVRVRKELACFRRHMGQISGANSDARAADHINLMRKFFGMKKVPAEIQAVKPEAMCWAQLVAGSISGSAWTALRHFIRGARSYPGVLVEYKTYDIIAKRLIHDRRKG